MLPRTQVRSPLRLDLFAFAHVGALLDFGLGSRAFGAQAARRHGSFTDSAVARSENIGQHHGQDEQQKRRIHQQAQPRLEVQWSSASRHDGREVFRNQIAQSMENRHLRTLLQHVVDRHRKKRFMGALRRARSIPGPPGRISKDPAAVGGRSGQAGQTMGAVVAARFVDAQKEIRAPSPDLAAQNCRLLREYQTTVQKFARVSFAQTL